MFSKLGQKSDSASRVSEAHRPRGKVLINTSRVLSSERQDTNTIHICRHRYKADDGN